jgi:hypothetical protein
VRVSSNDVSSAGATCSGCGASARDAGALDAVPLDWSTAVEAGRPLTFCPRCTRDNIRAIEGKLDSSWW